jgi:hypothetical protein
MIKNALALVLAVRCQNKDATLQLLALFYQTMPAAESRRLVMKTLYLLSVKERDWLRGLA